MTDVPTSNLVSRLRYRADKWDNPSIYGEAADEIERLTKIANSAVAGRHAFRQMHIRSRYALRRVVEWAGPMAEAPADSRPAWFNIAREALSGVAPDETTDHIEAPPFEPIIQCDTTTARVQKLIEMNAVPDYVVRALLHERDSWRENYWMRMEQIAKQGSPEEPEAHICWACQAVYTGPRAADGRGPCCRPAENGGGKQT